MVRKAGLEPACLSAPPPQDGVSANSTTSARYKPAGLNTLPARDRKRNSAYDSITVNLREHFQTTSGALGRWVVAQAQDSFAVGILWLVGLWIVHVPWAPLWAVLAAVFQIVPHFGPVLGMIGPVLAAALRWGDWEHPLYVLILYAVIAVLDGFLLQPYIMRRTAKVPVWASILAPIALGFVFPFWGVLAAPPLLAVVYAYKARREAGSSPP